MAIVRWHTASLNGFYRRKTENRHSARALAAIGGRSSWDLGNPHRTRGTLIEVWALPPLVVVVFWILGTSVAKPTEWYCRTPRPKAGPPCAEVVALAEAKSASASATHERRARAPEGVKYHPVTPARPELSGRGRRPSQDLQEGDPQCSTRSRARSDPPGKSYSSPHERIPRPCPGKEEPMCLRRARWTWTGPGPRPGVPVNPWGLCVERSVVGRSETPTNPTRRGCGVGGGANHAPPPRSAGRGRETSYSTERESRGGIGCTAGGHPQRAHPQTNLSHFDFSVR